MNEIWKDVIGYEGLYEVSNLGRVKSLKFNRKKILKGMNTNGYIRYTLLKNKLEKRYYGHQLVAIAFLNHKICGHKLIVDHINDNKYDNRLENLQIITQRENAYKTQGKYKSKYKGVGWNKNRNKWQVTIRINGKSKYIGIFKNEEEASKAYQNALKTLL